MYCFCVWYEKKLKELDEHLWTWTSVFPMGNMVQSVKPIYHKIKILKERMFFSLQEFKLYYLFLPIHMINLFYLLFSIYSSYKITFVFPKHMRDGDQNWFIINKVDVGMQFWISLNLIQTRKSCLDSIKTGFTKPWTHLQPAPSSFKPPLSSLQHPQRYKNQNIASNWAIFPNFGQKFKVFRLAWKLALMVYWRGWFRIEA